MNEVDIKKTIRKGENIRVEFKECHSDLSRNVFETVCAFLNRFGGEILLGVSDYGKIVGVDENCSGKLKGEFVSSLNNPQKLSPTVYLSVEEFKINGKLILYVHVPESSQVHRCGGRIFDRNEDGDFDVTDNTNLVSNLYMRKQSEYSENRIFPFLTLRELRKDVIRRARKLAVVQNPGHAWGEMDDLELLKSAQLYSKDYKSGLEGFTLAAVLLFGKDSVIASILPHYKTDAIVRRVDTDRYDDRDIVSTNLIDSYDRLMAFIGKNLPDKFYIENKQRINLRDNMFREVVSNILIHREFTNHFPAKLVIEKDCVVTENSNKPHGHGLINPTHFSPFPKNPVIAKVFKEIGRADELGSGVRNLFKYSKAYSGKNPKLFEGDTFKISIPVTPQATPQVTPQATPQVDREKVKKILVFCRVPRTRTEIQKHLKLSDREHFRKEILSPMLKAGMLLPTITDKPNSPKQKYYSAKLKRRKPL